MDLQISKLHLQSEVIQDVLSFIEGNNPENVSLCRGAISLILGFYTRWS